MNATGVSAGLLFAVGVLLINSAWQRSRPTLMARVAPYVRARRTSALLTEPTAASPSVVDRLLSPMVADASALLEHVGSSQLSVRARLNALGRTGGLEAFRLEQVLWSAIGLVIGLGAALLLTFARGVDLVPLIALVATATVAGALLRDTALTRAVKARERRMTTEFPTLAELLALAVGAGESPAAALDRVARSTQGELSFELDRTLADVRAGASMSTALGALARRSNLPAITRFADGVAIAIERGSPLAEVPGGRAEDARHAADRELMEAGGRKEIGMLVPVVFFVMPLTVLFALFPGISVFQVGF